MKDRTLIRTGIGGTTVAALCCVTPVLALLLGAVGLAAWLVWADYVLLPVLVMFLAIAAVGFYRRSRSKTAAAFCDDQAVRPQGRQE